MTNLTGTLSLEPTTTLDIDRQQLLDELNRVIRPPRVATDKSVYLGMLYAASDEVNLQGGCFDRQGLDSLANLVVDAPVLVGHRRDELPIGRVFRGEVAVRDGRPWLRAYFYWPADHPQAEMLRNGIDSGIYRECSLGFLYGKPECGVCREDMRYCRHRVGQRLISAGTAIRAFYYYRELAKVLEVSLVYRGAVNNTRVVALRPLQSNDSILPRNGYRLYLDDTGDGLLLLSHRGIDSFLRIRRLNVRLLQNGRRFPCSVSAPPSDSTAGDTHLNLIDRGEVTRFHNDVDGGIALTLMGSHLRGTYLIQPDRRAAIHRAAFSLRSVPSAWTTSAKEML